MPDMNRRAIDVGYWLSLLKPRRPARNNIPQAVLMTACHLRCLGRNREIEDRINPAATPADHSYKGLEAKNPIQMQVAAYLLECSRHTKSRGYGKENEKLGYGSKH